MSRNLQFAGRSCFPVLSVRVIAMKLSSRRIPLRAAHILQPLDRPLFSDFSFLVAIGSVIISAGELLHRGLLADQTFLNRHLEVMIMDHDQNSKLPQFVNLQTRD